MEINGKEYILETRTTSAPCGQCAFLGRPSLKCEFPEGYKKECNPFGESKTNGWESTEYYYKINFGKDMIGKDIKGYTDGSK